MIPPRLRELTRDCDTFTVHDLEFEFGLSRSTAERYLSEWAACGLIVEVEPAKLGRKGEPKLYQVGEFEDKETHK